MVNAGDFFAIPIIDSLENTGTGSNYGIELTVEKFLNKGFSLQPLCSIPHTREVTGFPGILLSMGTMYLISWPDMKKELVKKHILQLI